MTPTTLVRIAWGVVALALCGIVLVLQWRTRKPSERNRLPKGW